MKAFSIFIALFLISGSCPEYANSQTDSCGSNLTAVNGAQFLFDTSSLNCDAVWTAQDYILRYAQASPNVWSFVLSAPNIDCYVAMGFSPNGDMVGSSAIVGWVDSDGVGGVKQYYLGGQTPAQVLPDQGNLVIIGNSTSIVAVDSTIYMGFQLNASTPRNQLIYSVGPAGILPSSPSYRLTQHQNMVTTTMNYLTGQTQTVKAPYSNLKKNHGILNMLGWGILLPIGAIVARHCKEWDPIWFYSHISIQSLGFILGLAGISCGFVLEHKLSAIVSHHKGIGIFILILGCLQMMAILARPDKASKRRKYWNWYHHNVGRLMIFFAVVNVFYGIHLGLAGRGWDVGYGIVLVGLFIIAAVLEVRMWMRK
ncbi:cytochrome b561 and DOMON domain-containing protein At3g07570-like isoform X2 [Rhododendron vialii]|uniref:cytochrome b561 and DOMON domain-containing protein At3g07570-like isoform X1 n=1 Tax=Rhododendron vialii TaxID=182163 RepID=UPI00265F659D|nr:cytochrome b561 and DOMON domain-containing protein At3g07570-like isoform X1 [Rhododendron vialii]XP_058199788.1 cytochrome b561 and DOMON domain-containing protein At3g07570-like isoform X2 [Rhododendron vialii]